MVRHQLIENRGASITDHQSHQLHKANKIMKAGAIMKAEARGHEGWGQAFYSRQSFAIRVLCFLHSSSWVMRSEYREINELTVAMSRPKHLATSLSL